MLQMNKNTTSLLIGLILAMIFTNVSAQYNPNRYYAPNYNSPTKYNQAYYNQAYYNHSYYRAAPYQPYYYQQARPAYNSPAYNSPAYNPAAYGWQTPEQNQPDTIKPKTKNKAKSQQITTLKKPVVNKQISKRNAVSAKPKNSNTNKDKKQKLIKLLLPYINAENEAILKSRNWLLKIITAVNNGASLNTQQQQQLKKLMHSYRIKNQDIATLSVQTELLSKVDIIPASLTLAQAANESAWGTSRFAKEANNFFGIWTYDENKGLKPKKRDSNKKHFVRKFENAGESVQYYIHMLNSHPAYKDLREIRKKLRSQEQAISGYDLAHGLEKYSAKGDRYIALIQQLIAQNQWTMLDDVNTKV